MSNNIQIEVSKILYEKLAKHADGFEKPQDVIERLITSYEETCKEQKLKQRPNIFFSPSSEEKFKTALLESKKAWRAIIKNNGDVEIQVWNASRFTKKSNLQANLWSGILRSWKKDDIKTVILSIEPLSPEYSSLMQLIENNIYEQKDSTRALARVWSENNYANLLVEGFKSSKHFPDHDWWFFTFDASTIEKEGNTNLLLSIPNAPEQFYLLVIPNYIFAENKDNLKIRDQNGKQVFDLRISSKKANWLLTNSPTPLKLAPFLIEQL